MPKIAIAHDYFTQRGGAERVALAMMRAFPGADLYTTVYNPETTFPELQQYTVYTTALNKLSLLRKDHRFGLPLYQKGIDEAPAIEADLLLVSTTGFAHGFRTTGKKLVYCHSPARFLYLVDDYLGGKQRSPIGAALNLMRPSLIKWDQAAAHSADRYLANSTVVKDRIKDVYGIDATVVPAPPAVSEAVEPEPVKDLEDWGPGHHLIVSRLLPYKNVDKAIEAFRDLPNERLVIVGKGPMRDELRKNLPDNVRMLEGISDGELAWCYANAKALIAPSFEDYGLTPLEAGAFGTPTLALHAGGYLDTVKDGLNGTFFEESTPEAIRNVVLRASTMQWGKPEIREHVAQFDEDHFAAALKKHVEELLS